MMRSGSMRALSRGVLVVAVAVGAAACGGRQSGLVADNGPVQAKGDATAAVERGRGLWKERESRARVDEAIKAWEEAVALDPTRADIQLDLAYAYYFLGHAHLRWEEDAEDRLLAAYEKGVAAGERAIKLATPAFADKIKNGQGWQEAVKTVPKEGIPGLYWYATNLGRWALIDGFTTILSHKDDIAATMDHVRTLDETFYYGAPHRYFGVFRTKVPFPGGDLPKSKEHFEKAISIAPNYLDTKVLFAENYAAKAQDEALFRKLLNEVLAAPDDILPDVIPETKNAKRIARKLLDDVEEYF